MLYCYLARWVRKNDTVIRVCSGPLGEEDNKPIQFWSYVVTALQSVEPELGEPAMALLQTPQSLPDESIPTVLINDLVRSAIASSKCIHYEYAAKPEQKKFAPWTCYIT
jgi:ATP/maltotriose-dependent transcriptional regulator MalT